mmetsp:Transcript_5947/g.14727  ORF Transcript_5947/g.14727 Transcript_5947/m.14727 type:complete len:319 (+) Transcript_5947:133-1089(+)
MSSVMVVPLLAGVPPRALQLPVRLVQHLAQPRHGVSHHPLDGVGEPVQLLRRDLIVLHEAARERLVRLPQLAQIAQEDDLDVHHVVHRHLHLLPRLGHQHGVQHGEHAHPSGGARRGGIHRVPARRGDHHLQRRRHHQRDAHGEHHHIHEQRHAEARVRLAHALVEHAVHLLSSLGGQRGVPVRRVAPRAELPQRRGAAHLRQKCPGRLLLPLTLHGAHLLLQLLHHRVARHVTQCRAQRLHGILRWVLGRRDADTLGGRPHAGHLLQGGRGGAHDAGVVVRQLHHQLRGHRGARRGAEALDGEHHARPDAVPERAVA